jgi:hypothetical protein
MDSADTPPRLMLVTADGITRGPNREEVRQYATEWVAYARRARKAGRNPQQLAHEHLRAIGAFMATLPAPARAGFDQMLAEELEAAHAAAERRKKR